MGDIPATRYRERVMGESHEATEMMLANRKTLLFVSSGSLTTTQHLMPPGFGPLEGALVASLFFLVSITHLLDAS